MLTPERVVAAETRRTLTALALHGIRVDERGREPAGARPAGVARGAAATWLRDRRHEQDAVLAELDRVSADDAARVDHRAAEPVGVPALLEVAEQLYGDDDPLPGAAGVRAAAGGVGQRTWARRPSSSCGIALPLADDTELDLARVGDDLAVTVDGTASAGGAALVAAALRRDRRRDGLGSA